MAKVDWGVSCGKGYLLINDYVVAMEGDRCWDGEFDLTDFEKTWHIPYHCWTLKDFKRICNEN